MSSPQPVPLRNPSSTFHRYDTYVEWPLPILSHHALSRTPLPHTEPLYSHLLAPVCAWLKSNTTHLYCGVSKSLCLVHFFEEEQVNFVAWNLHRILYYNVEKKSRRFSRNYFDLSLQEKMKYDWKSKTSQTLKTWIWSFACIKKMQKVEASGGIQI